MAQRIKSKQIMVGLEPELHAIAFLGSQADGKSMSGYARALIIRDVINKGLLTEAMLQTLVSR